MVTAGVEIKANFCLLIRNVSNNTISKISHFVMHGIYHSIDKQSAYIPLPKYGCPCLQEGYKTYLQIYLLNLPLEKVSTFRYIDTFSTPCCTRWAL